MTRQKKPMNGAAPTTGTPGNERGEPRAGAPGPQTTDEAVHSEINDAAAALQKAATEVAEHCAEFVKIVRKHNAWLEDALAKNRETTQDAAAKVLLTTPVSLLMAAGTLISLDPDKTRRDRLLEIFKTADWTPTQGATDSSKS